MLQVFTNFKQARKNTTHLCLDESHHLYHELGTEVWSTTGSWGPIRAISLFEKDQLNKKCQRDKRPLVESAFRWQNFSAAMSRQS